VLPTLTRRSSKANSGECPGAMPLLRLVLEDIFTKHILFEREMKR